MANDKNKPITTHVAPRGFDPLEAAKVVPPSEPQPPAAPSDVLAPQPSARAQEAAPEPPAARVEPTPAPPVKRWRVLEDKRISLRGQMVVMRAGRVLTPEFAHQHLAHLIDQGVNLEEIG
jgi:hypothetical protein